MGDYWFLPQFQCKWEFLVTLGVSGNLKAYVTSCCIVLPSKRNPSKQKKYRSGALFPAIGSSSPTWTAWSGLRGEGCAGSCRDWISQGGVVSKWVFPSLRVKGGYNGQGFIRSGLGGIEGLRSGCTVNKNVIGKRRIMEKIMDIIIFRNNSSDKWDGQTKHSVQ